jgi:hypothetical protein
MEDPPIRFPTLAVKTIVSHTLTYLLMGALAAYFLNYAELTARHGSGMRPIANLWVTGGTLFQPLRGLIFALVFFPLRGCLFGRKHGWLLMGWMLVGLGILSTFGPASGSIEGMVYTLTPVLLQLRGWLEVVPQALLLSALLCYWVNHPGKKWMNWTLGALFFIAIALPILGLVAGHPH